MFCPTCALAIHNTFHLTKSIRDRASGVSYLGNSGCIPRLGLRIRRLGFMCDRESPVFSKKSLSVIKTLETLVIMIILLILIVEVLGFSVRDPFHKPLTHAREEPFASSRRGAHMYGPDLARFGWDSSFMGLIWAFP